MGGGFGILWQDLALDHFRQRQALRLVIICPIKLTGMNYYELYLSLALCLSVVFLSNLNLPSRTLSFRGSARILGFAWIMLAGEGTSEKLQTASWRQWVPLTP